MPGLLSVIDFHQRADLRDRFERARSVIGTGPGVCQDAWRDGAGIAALGRVDNGLFNPAPQPLASPDGRYRVFFQGELYDRAAKLAALKARGAGLPGDDHATLLLATYLAEGLGGVGRLNGSFFFLLWDDAAQTLVVGGDRHANRPHFYALDEDRFILAPEARAVAAACQRPPGVYLPAIAEFLALEHPLADHTFYEGVRAFPGGTFLTLSRSGTRWEVYWRLAFTAPDEERERPPETWLPEAAHRLRQAVMRQLEPPVGLFLSGGTDSRLILAAAERWDLPAVTFGTEDSEDVQLARRVAALAKLEHHVLALRPDFLSANAPEILARGEGMSSLFHAHNCEGLDAVRAIAPVMLAGNTSLFLRTEYVNDVLLPETHSRGGRAWQLLNQAALGHPPRRRFTSDEELVERMVQQAWTAVPPAIAREVLAPELVAEMERALREGIAAQFARVHAPALADRLIAYNIINRQRRFTHWGLAMTSHAHEFRKPFDDYDLVDFVLQLPHGTRRRMQTRLICHYSPALAALPRTGTGGASIDANLLQRALGVARKEFAALRPAHRAQSFVDPQEALRTHSRAFYEQVLLDPSTLQSGYFRPEGLKKLVEAHMSGRANLAGPLLAIATLALWQRKTQGGRIPSEQR